MKASNESNVDAPENVKILAARFPVVLDRLLQVGDRASDNFFYQEEGKTAVLMMQRGEHAFPVYGKRNKEKTEQTLV